MASLTQWTWVWVNSRSWWWTGRSGVLRFMGSQRVDHNWVTELNWTDGFSSSPVLMWELDYKESWAPKNWCLWTVVLKKTVESSLDSKEIKPVSPKGKLTLNVHWKDWCWSWNSNTLATSSEELTHLKRLWCWERLRAGGEGDDRGWDGWMALPTQWTWVWVNSGSWWWTGRPGVLRFMGSQRVGHDWVTELKWLNLVKMQLSHYV